VSEGASPRIPTSTYRLQFHAGFTFDDARQIVDYLKALGISDVYASPYFQSAPESTHGYDVSDHNRLNPLIGDEASFQAYCTALREHQMGQVLDFVPNHMGIGGPLNTWWMDTLEDGRTSPYARYFDIEWRPIKTVLSDRILLPILGDRYGEVLEQGGFKLFFEAGGFFLSYSDTRLPISPASYAKLLRSSSQHLDSSSQEALDACAREFAALPSDQSRSQAKVAAKLRLRKLAESNEPVAKAIDLALRSLEGQPGNSSSFDALHELLDEQVYRLSYWRTAAEEINYRRFFDINHLAAIRVEIPEVFEAAHQLVFKLLASGDVTGLRIDHVDGLWNPRSYLHRLQKRYRELRALSDNEQGLFLVVEKILDLTKESLPLDWPVHGTTGYEFANQMVQIFTDPSAERRMTKIFQNFTGLHENFAALAYEKKLLTMQFSLSSEIAALGKSLDELSEMYRVYRDFTTSMLTSAVREVLACFPVYRTYTTEEGVVSEEDERVILRAILAARRRNPSLENPVLDFLRGVLLLRLPEHFSPEERTAHIRFVMKFQQCSGPIMAKGVEDTAFYVYNRLLALNEVGGKPEQFGINLADFHNLNQARAKHWPHTLLATSTHDTKRSEDVRTRMVALSEVPQLWSKAIRRWSKLNKKFRVEVDDQRAPSPNEEYLIYQILLGTWPLDDFHTTERLEYLRRIQQYLVKAIKEAKINSSWIEPNEAWEQATTTFVEKILNEETNGKFCRDLAELAQLIAELGAVNSLAETIVKCTAPGIPDIYQGTEIWDWSLVDPDNRRKVDYLARRQLLASLLNAPPSELLKDWQSGRIKLFVIQRLLAFRAANQQVFLKGSYQAVSIVGEHAQSVIAFERTFQSQRLLVIVPRLTYQMGVWPTGNVWKETLVTGLASREAHGWQDVLLQRGPITLSDTVDLSAILSDLPFAVLFWPG
jgi:(1->4)-alpha-D-glucan 1-alpha-D-glucosylmutase